MRGGRTPRVSTEGKRSSRTRVAGNDAGTVTMLILAGIFFLSASLVAGVGLLSQARRPVADYRVRLAKERELENAALGILRLLAEDPTPDADSRFDPAWAAAALPTAAAANLPDTGETLVGAAGKNQAGEISLTLEDLSSRLNVNLAPAALLHSASLPALVRAGCEWEDLLHWRNTEGPFGSLAAFGEWLDLEAAERLLTVYGYVDPNTAAPEMVARFVEVREKAGDAGVAPSSATALKALINTQPSVNLNLAPPEVVRALVELVESPRGGENLAGHLASSILAERELHEIGPTDLRELIARVEGAWPEADHPLLAQLGVRTWFWRITAADGRIRLVEVAARLPQKELPSFALIGRRFFDLPATRGRSG